MKFVIIEDEIDLGQLVGNFLRRKANGSTVKTATTLRDGLIYIEELDPDVVFLDNNLPDGKGINQIASLKAAHSDLVVVMMSAMTNLREEALRQGVDYFIDKPISFVEIQRILNEKQVS